MATSKIQIQKYIYQIRYKPSLSFYEKLFKLDGLFNEFEHWQTDRLRINLRDYDNRHSLSIKHDSTTFESDDPSISKAKQIIKSVYDNFDQYSNTEEIQRLGCRYLGFIKNELSFEELNGILKLKFFNKVFLEKINRDEVYDHSVVFNTIIKNKACRIKLGPISRAEIPQLIQFNTDNHLDPNSPDKYDELAKIFSQYPDQSLFFDLDIFDDKSRTQNLHIVNFQEESHLIFEKLVNDLRNFIFLDKLK